MGADSFALCRKVSKSVKLIYPNIFYDIYEIFFYIYSFSHTLRNINDWTIQLGITRRHSHSYYGEKVKIRRVIPHPQYNSEITHDNDIALFQVSDFFCFA